MPAAMDRVFFWLVRDWQWPYAGLFAGGFLLLLAPLWFTAFGLALTLVYLQIPLYLVHQYEEHDGDRLRQFVNRRVAGGREALTRTATFWINALIWVIDVAALYLACFVHPALGLIAIYLTVINSAIHLLGALALRAYNPGLWTGLLLFVPCGGWGLYEVARASQAGWIWHSIGAGVSVLFHLASMTFVRWRSGRLRACEKTTFAS